MNVVEFPLIQRHKAAPIPASGEGVGVVPTTFNPRALWERVDAQWPSEGAFRRMLDGFTVPAVFWTATYSAAHYPGAAGVRGLQGGANCQQFAYELLRANGYAIGEMRSSELWTDASDTALVTDELAPGDLLLFHFKPEAYAAHVAVYLGHSRAIHLAQRIGKPVIWTLDQFLADPLYRHFIGAKRPVRRQA